MAQSQCSSVPAQSWAVKIPSLELLTLSLLVYASSWVPCLPQHTSLDQGMSIDYQQCFIVRTNNDQKTWRPYLPELEQRSTQHGYHHWQGLSPGLRSSCSYVCTSTSFVFSVWLQGVYAQGLAGYAFVIGTIPGRCFNQTTFPSLQL